MDRGCRHGVAVREREEREGGEREGIQAHTRGEWWRCFRGWAESRDVGRGTWHGRETKGRKEGPGDGSMETHAKRNEARRGRTQSARSDTATRPFRHPRQIRTRPAALLRTGKEACPTHPDPRAGNGGSEPWPRPWDGQATCSNPSNVEPWLHLPLQHQEE